MSPADAKGKAVDGQCQRALVHLDKDEEVNYEGYLQNKLRRSVKSTNVFSMKLVSLY